MSNQDEAPEVGGSPEERRTDPSVVSGTSSVDLSQAPPPRPAPKPDLLADLDDGEQITISPDEFDDIWQTGVRARAELLDGLMTKAEREAEAERELGNTRFELQEQPAEGEARDWEHREEPNRVDHKRATDPSAAEEDWRVDHLGRDTAKERPTADASTPFGIPDDVSGVDLAGPTSPSRRAATEVIRPQGMWHRLRRSLARLLRNVAGWLEP